MKMENLGKRNIVTEECFMVDGDDLLNFSLPCEEDDDESTSTLKISSSSHPLTTRPDDICGSSSLPPDFFEEEELEWLSDKNAFPSVESCFDILSHNPDIIELDQQSPISVLENSTSSSNGHSHGDGSSFMSCCQSFQVPTSFPVRARSKIRRKRRKEGFFGNLPDQHLLWWNPVNVVVRKNKQQELALSPWATTETNTSPSIGRRCLHCGADKTPQWRVGPMGPKTLCNACGVRYKSGRLVPEYRPASSPSFSAAIHSNSHRKIIKMRKEKQYQAGFGGINGNDTCGYRIG